LEGVRGKPGILKDRGQSLGEAEQPFVDVDRHSNRKRGLGAPGVGDNDVSVRGTYGEALSSLTVESDYFPRERMAAGVDDASGKCLRVGRVRAAKRRGDIYGGAHGLPPLNLWSEMLVHPARHSLKHVTTAQ